MITYIERKNKPLLIGTYFTLLKEGKITVSDVAKALRITEAEVEERFKTDSIQ